MIWSLDVSWLMYSLCLYHVYWSNIADTCHHYLVSHITGHRIQSCFRLLNILSYTCIDYVCPTTVLVAVVLLYTLFLLSSVPYVYLLVFSGVLIANPYVRTLTVLNICQFKNPIIIYSIGIVLSYLLWCFILYYPRTKFPPMFLIIS